MTAVERAREADSQKRLHELQVQARADEIEAQLRKDMEEKDKEEQQHTQVGHSTALRAAAKLQVKDTCAAPYRHEAPPAAPCSLASLPLETP